MEEEEIVYFDDVAQVHGLVVHESEPLPSIFTGLFDSQGKPVYRMAVDKPRIGFIHDPEEAELYDLDPDQDTFYTTEP